MEIHGNGPTATALAGACRDMRPADADATGTGEAAGERADDTGGARVALSERAREMLAIKQAVDEAPDVRAAHVDHIRERIGAGTYDVKGKLVAEALARNALVEAVA